jgi:hypothetical protein
MVVEITVNDVQLDKGERVKAFKLTSMLRFQVQNAFTTEKNIFEIVSVQMFNELNIFKSSFKVECDQKIVFAKCAV